MPESVCSKPAVPLGQPVFSVPGAPSVFHRAARKVWKSLHAAAFYTPGSPPHSASRQHWGQLVRLISPLASSAPPRGGTAPGKPPHRKIPGTRSGMPGIFLLRFNGRHAGEPLPLSTAAAAEGGKLSPVRAFAGRRRSAHRPACFRCTAARRRSAGQTAPSENPRHSLWNAGDFYPFTAAVPGVTSARRSHGLPL